ncbi:MAG: flavin reductase [Variovorax paradoxus]|nr:MAG: flavin reductase [Variovorax paradoxus]PZQ15550.1 MAG: flavin reductase [Variovorax paradoxus]
MSEVTGMPFDARDLRRVLGTFVTGVTVVTTADGEGRRFGLTANSFSSVSLDPPLILWSQANKAPSHEAFYDATHFAINILAEDQIELSNRFATSAKDKFDGLPLDEGVAGVPLLRGCSAWLECKTVQRLPGGDHTIYVGEICALRQTERRPLVFGGGQYLVADPHDLGTPPAGVSTTGQEQLRATRLGMRAIARLAREFDETLAVAVWGNHGPTVIAWESSRSPVSDNLPIGLALPVTSTAMGRAFAAHLPEEATQRLVAAELQLAHAGDSDWPATQATWREELDGVRRHGLARRTPGRFHGNQRVVNALSAPVLGPDGNAILAIAAIGDAGVFLAELDSPLAHALAKTAQGISQRLAGPPQRQAA